MEILRFARGVVFGAAGVAQTKLQNLGKGLGKVFSHSSEKTTQEKTTEDTASNSQTFSSVGNSPTENPLGKRDRIRNFFSSTIPSVASKAQNSVSAFFKKKNDE